MRWGYELVRLACSKYELVPKANTHTHGHTHPSTHAHAHAHARTRTRTHAYTRTHAHARTRTRTHTRTHTHTHTCARTRAHPHAHANTPTHNTRTRSQGSHRATPISRQKRTTIEPEHSLMWRNSRTRRCSRDRDVYLEIRLVHVRAGLAKFGEGAFRGFGYLAVALVSGAMGKKKKGVGDGESSFVRLTSSVCRCSTGSQRLHFDLSALPEYGGG
jgi:hypothetical protein